MIFSPSEHLLLLLNVIQKEKRFGEMNQKQICNARTSKIKRESMKRFEKAELRRQQTEMKIKCHLLPNFKTGKFKFAHF